MTHAYTHIWFRCDNDNVNVLQSNWRCGIYVLTYNMCIHNHVRAVAAEHDRVARIDAALAAERDRVVRMEEALHESFNGLQTKMSKISIYTHVIHITPSYV
jgi:hypothetical protein